MAYYPLRKANNEGSLLRPQHTFCSEEYAENMCNLFLKECVMEDGQGTLHKYYRLHANHPHNHEMALAYDILCPKCRVSMLKQVGRANDCYELGLYICPVCEKKKGGCK